MSLVTPPIGCAGTSKAPWESYTTEPSLRLSLTEREEIDMVWSTTRRHGYSRAAFVLILVVLAGGLAACGRAAQPGALRTSGPTSNSSAPCVATHLKLGLNQLGAAGTALYEFSVTNAQHASCTIQGYFTIWLVGRDGAILSSHDRREPTSPTGERLPALRRFRLTYGSTVTTTVSFDEAPVEGTTCHSIKEFRITIPKSDSVANVTLTDKAAFCQPLGSTVVVYATERRHS